MSWVLSGTLLLIVLLNLAASYGMNLWHRVIFDALQTRDSDTVLLLSMLYVPLLAGSAAAIISSILWVARTRTPNVVSPTTRSIPCCLIG
jgi:putative ATP-binding cassette transporter